MFFAYGVLLAYVVASIVATRWTWRRLWRPAADDWERVVYTLGVRQAGVGLWIFWTLVQPVWRAYDRGEPLLSREVLAFAIFSAFTGWIWLWAGYWWGRVRAGYFGLERRGS